MARCPCCGERPVFRWRPSEWWVWVPWVCHGCGAKVRTCFRRRAVLASVLFAAFGVQLMSWLLDMRWLWPVGFVLTLPAFACLALFDKLEVIARGPFCAECGYDVSGVPAGATCPECGRASPPRLEPLTARQETAGHR